MHLRSTRLVWLKLQEQLRRFFFAKSTAAMTTNQNKHKFSRQSSVHFLSWTKRWASPYENVFSGICGQLRPRSACASAQSDPGLHCPHTESLHTDSTERKCPDETCTYARYESVHSAHLRKPFSDDATQKPVNAIVLICTSVI